MTGSPAAYDVAVVGAGVVGLAAAYDAVQQGLRVAVVDRDDRAVGASVRNFGHICTTVQAGKLRDYALVARKRWLQLAADGVLAVHETGTLVVARADDEYEVLRELHALHGDEVQLLESADVSERFRDGDDIVGAALLPMDLRVDPRTAAADIATSLAQQGVDFHWSTQVQRVEPGHLVTGTGAIAADRIVVAVGHDVDTLYPQQARAAGVRRCTLSMTRVANPLGHQLIPAVLTGFSMLRYPAFAECASLAAVRDRLTRADPAALEADLNLMTTSLPNGDLVLGDTHRYHQHAVSPFPPEDDTRLVLARGQRLLGTDDLEIVERWQGIYASAPEPYLVAHPEESVTVVSVTTGVGMTTAFGFVADVVSIGSSVSQAQPG